MQQNLIDAARAVIAADHCGPRRNGSNGIKDHRKDTGGTCATYPL